MFLLIGETRADATNKLATNPEQAIRPVEAEKFRRLTVAFTETALHSNIAFRPRTAERGLRVGMETNGMEAKPKTGV